MGQHSTKEHPPLPQVLSLNTHLLRRPWTRLDRYIFSEITTPFLGAMLVYNGIFFLQIIAEIADLSGSNFNIPFSLYLWFFLSQIPEILSITVAMSFLFASLTAIGRMSVDSEIIAPQSLGISFWRMSRPILAYGLVLTLALSAMNHWIGPWLNQEKTKVANNFARNFKMPNIQQGVINTFGPDTALYVGGVDQGRLAEVFIVNESDTSETMLLADRAVIYTNRELQLFQAVKISLGPKTIETIAADQLKNVIPAVKKFNEDRIQGHEQDRLNSLELFTHLPAEPAERQRAQLTLWNRFWSPFVCLVFALYAVPLAAKHSRMRKSAGFGFSLMVIGMYFLLSKIGRDLATAEKLPMWIAMSAPPILFLILGALLQIGKAGWWSQRFQRFQDRVGYWIRYGFTRFFDLFRRKRHKKGMVTASKTARTFIFPSKLDAYVTRSFFSIYLMVQLSLLMLMLLIEYTQVSKAARQNSISGETLIRYLLYKIPEMVDMSLFICLLIATLLMLSIMSKNQEVTAIRAAGGSLQRLCFPLLVIALLGSLFSYYVSNSFVPKTNRQAIALKNFIKNRTDLGISRDQWLKNGNGELINFKYFDPSTKSLVGLKRYRFSHSSNEVLHYTSIPKLSYDNQWRVDGEGKAWTFAYKGPQRDSIQATPANVPVGERIDLDLGIKDLSSQRRRASEFSIRELRQYLTYIRSMGAAGTDFQTELYGKYSRPFMPLIMMLLAMPLGFHFGRRGSFHGIAFGLIAGMVFWGLFEFCKTLGNNGLLNPVVAGWSVVMVAGFLSLYRFINLKE